ncbi:MAG: NADPH-dependent F420 reductase [Anaerolineae bacterium]
MKTGVLGSGNVGQAIASGAIAQGHEVMIGSRDPQGEKAQTALAALGSKATAGTYADVARFGDIVFLTVPWRAAQEALEQAGVENLAGKVLVDVTNAAQWGPNGPSVSPDLTKSAGEMVQEWAPAARVVKAFDHVGANLMADGKSLGEVATLFIAGNDDDAKEAVASFGRALGWDVVDIGGIEQARHIEALAVMWMAYARKYGSREHAFRLIRK